MQGEPGQPGAQGYLRQCIAREMAAAGGWLPFERFMALALYAPGLGYYARGAAVFGRGPGDGSDFVTAPLLSPRFGATLARQLAQALAATGTDEIWEFGAGDGTLAAQLLAALDKDQTWTAVVFDGEGTPSTPPAPARCAATAVARGDDGTHPNTEGAFGRDGSGPQCPGFGVCAQPRTVRYHIVEVSAVLRQRQAQRLTAWAPRVTWHDRLPDVLQGVLVGNEVLDAMPVTLLHRVGGQWHERGVAWDAAAARFVWTDRPTDKRPPVEVEGTHDYLTEIHPQAEAFVRTVGQRLQRGAAFFIDYGFPEREYYHPQRAMGTLMCHRAHRADADPLADVGDKDITAHVNFTGIALAAQEAGLQVLGYTSQGRFLLNAGLLDGLDTAPLPERAAALKLVHEHEMGELFKVIALAPAVSAQGWMPLGFVHGDRTHTL